MTDAEKLQAVRRYLFDCQEFADDPDVLELLAITGRGDDE